MELLKEHRNLIEKLVKACPKYSGNEDLLEDFCSETYQKSYLIIQSVQDENALEAYMKRVVSSAIIDVLKNSGRVVRSTKGYSSVKEISLSANSKTDTETSASGMPQISTAVVEESSSDEQVIDDEHADITNIEIEDNIVEESPLIQEEYEIDDVEKAEEIESIEENIYSVSQSSQPYPYVQAPYNLSDDLAEIKDPRESIEEQVIRKDILENIINLVKQIDMEQPEELYLKLFYQRYFLQLKQREISQNLDISQAEISKRLVQLSRLIKEKLY